MDDTFRGDDAHLVRSIEAHLALDAAGALVPHGVGGLARVLLASAAARLSAALARSGQAASGSSQGARSDDQTAKRIFPPEPDPMPSICAGMTPEQVWEYGHLCGWRAGQPEAPTAAPLEPATEWRCFHCDEVFAEHAAALEHFGASELQSPMCCISPTHVRWLEEQHRRHVEDDSDALRSMHCWASEHEDLRRKAEELGYARGLADAKKHPEDLGLAHPPARSGAGSEENKDVR